MKGIHGAVELISPSVKHLNDPYVLQLIEALSRQQDQIEELEVRINDRLGAEHYGPYGTACMNTGQFDAGECWLCYAKRKKKAHKQCSDAFNDLEAASGAWEAAANSYKEKAGEMQLIAGRYQYQFEHAMKCINKIDDLFEYAYEKMTPDQLRVVVRTSLAKFSDAVKPKS